MSARAQQHANPPLPRTPWEPAASRREASSALIGAQLVSVRSASDETDSYR